MFINDDSVTELMTLAFVKTAPGFTGSFENMKEVKYLFMQKKCEDMSYL